MTNPAEPTDSIACDLFEFAPISLWEEDYSGVKAYLDQLRAEGVSDLAAHLASHPQPDRAEQQILFRAGPQPVAGHATGELGSNLAEVLRRADDKMYVEKRLHHGR